MTQDQNYVTAVHEAAHAVTAVILGQEVKVIEVAHRRGQKGVTTCRQHIRGGPWQQYALNAAIVSMAGPIAQAKLFPEQPSHIWHGECSGDFANIGLAIGAITQHSRGLAREVFAAVQEGSEKIVNDYWREILAVAKGVLSHPERRLRHEEVVKHMRNAGSAP